MTRTGTAPPTKVYDREYYDRWYRGRRAVVKPENVRRKARLALAVAESVLGREIRSVLDVGCGEAPWRGLLRRMRPRLRYVGVDSSEYVVQRFGRRRGIRLGTLAGLDRLGLRGPFDLVVCADVLEYVPTPELRAGLRHIHQLTAGVAYVEAFPIEDDMVGDFDNWHHRSARAYREEFRRADLVPCGMHCYVPAGKADRLGALERCGTPHA
jgi:SAM-dependent methyltransferase